VRRRDCEQQHCFHFLRINAQMFNLDIAKNGARPETVSGNFRTTENDATNNFHIDNFDNLNWL